MTEGVLNAVIQGHVKSLHMPAIGREYEAMARRAGDDGWSYQAVSQ